MPSSELSVLLRSETVEKIKPVLGYTKLCEYKNLAIVKQKVYY